MHYLFIFLHLSFCANSIIDLLKIKKNIRFNDEVFYIFITHFVYSR